MENSGQSAVNPPEQESAPEEFRPISPEEVQDPTKLNAWLENNIREPDGLSFGDRSATNPETNKPYTYQEQIVATRKQLAGVVDAMNPQSGTSTDRVAKYLNNFAQKTLTRPSGIPPSSNTPPASK